MSDEYFVKSEYYDDGVRFGTGSEMIAEVKRLRSELEASRHRVAELEHQLANEKKCHRLANTMRFQQEDRDRARISALEAALTPSEETKFAYMGEVNFHHTDFDEDGNEHRIRMDVPWTSIKTLMKLIRENADLRTARSTLEGKHPNAESLAAIQELEDGGGETFSSVDDLMEAAQEASQAAETSGAISGPKSD
jgi:hypothetical protein